MFVGTQNWKDSKCKQQIHFQINALFALTIHPAVMHVCQVPQGPEIETLSPTSFLMKSLILPDLLPLST